MTKKWWCLLWLGWILVITAVTTLPWSNFVSHSHWSSVRWIPLQDMKFSYDFFVDFSGNILLFVPFGYMQFRSGLALPRRELRSISMAALTLSLAAEFTQVYMHNRIASATDVLCNVTGGIIGGFVGLLKLF